MISIGIPPWNNLNNSEHLESEHMTKTFGASEKHFADIVFKKVANFSRTDTVLFLLKDKPDTLFVGFLKMALSVYLQIGLTFRFYLEIKLTWHNFYCFGWWFYGRI